jgi:riboflavin kinase/FMN adenylyltransferase
VKVYRGIDEFENVENAVVTTGTFDGVHVGHRKILNRLGQVAENVNGESVLLTFYPHPRSVLQPESQIKMLNTLDEKIDLLEKAGIDNLIIHPFTKEFSRTSSVEFVRDILVNKIGTKKLVIGYDHHFGRNREGSFEHLKEFGPMYGFDVEEISALDIDEVNVSSTKIRKALEEGDVQTANTFLSYSYPLMGKVIRGEKLGRSIGYPTANIDIEESIKLIPANGVYAVKVKVEGEQFSGMLNIGVRPTVSQSQKKSVEVNIFDFDRDIYDEEITVEFIQRIRNEKKFNSGEELAEQLKQDKEACQEALGA